MRPKGQIFDLKRLRKDHNLAQKDVAKAIGVSTSFLSAIEHGRRPAPQSFLHALKTIYNIDNVEQYLIDESVSKNRDEIRLDFANSTTNVQYDPTTRIINLVKDTSKTTFTKAEVCHIIEMQEQELTVQKPFGSLDEGMAPHKLSSLDLAIKMLHDAKEELSAAKFRIAQLEAQVSDLQR